MKYISVLILFILASCQPSSDSLQNELMGRWEMKQVFIFDNDQTTDLNPNADRWIQFNPDFTFISGGSLGRNKGAYRLSDDILFIDSDAGEGDDSEWEIIIRNDSLIMKGYGTDRQESSKIFNTKSNLNHPSISIDIYEVPSSTRGLEIAEDGTVWFAGAEGKWGYSTDQGNSWNIKTIEYKGVNPNFRALEITNKAVFLLSIESPALLYKSVDQGVSWDLVYSEEGEGVFYDALQFWDDNNGIAVGDAINGCLSILITTDGGSTWKKLPCEILPPALGNEGCFAASDTNIKTLDSAVWIGTTQSRLYHSPDLGNTWEVIETPITNETETAGIFTVDFSDASYGIIMGGDFNDPEKNEANVAKTSDGGKTWELVSVNQDPDYRSCIQYVPGSEGRDLWAVGFQGMSHSSNGGLNWSKISEAEFFSIRINKDGKSGWLAGNKKIGYWVID